MKTRILLLVLSCAIAAVLALSQPRREEPALASAAPSPALLDAMSSHGIATAGEADTPQAPPEPVMQPAAYRGGAPN